MSWLRFLACKSPKKRNDLVRDGHKLQTMRPAENLEQKMCEQVCVCVRVHAS